MHKTVIGSWPVFYGEHGKAAIRMAVEDQVAAGVDVISDGQTRNYMVEYFSNLIEGFNCHDCPIDFCNKDCGDGAAITGTIRHDAVFDETILEDLAYALHLSPGPVKGIITGPTTLVNCSRLATDAYESLYDKELFTDLSKALVRIARDMLDIGVSSIQIDEPFMSVGSPSHLAKYSLEYLCSHLDTKVSLHVCGDVHKEIYDSITDVERSVFDIIMGIRGIESVSLSFAAYPQNKHCIAQYAHSVPPKKIGIGCVRTDSDTIESKKQVFDLLRYAVWCLGEDNVIAVPDCGMKILSRETACTKLAVMCEAADDLTRELASERSYR
jgi:5-methyltetrahydropteroyltriglutamate--homocysteine methyltransferase